MPQLDYTTFTSQLFWLALTFITLYLLLSKKVLPVIRDVLQARQDRIAHDLEKAGIAKTEAEEAKVAYTKSLEEARHKAAARVTGTLAAIQKQSSARHTELDKKLATEAEQMAERVDAMKAEAHEQLQPVTMKLAEAISAKLLGTAFSNDAIAAVVKGK